MKKPGRKVLSALLAAFVLLAALSLTAAAADDVAIDAVNFPDENFRSFVIENFDSDGDSFLNAEELQAVKSVDVRSRDISDLSGIELFTELTWLDCAFNNLSALDVSACEKLEYLNCNYNNYMLAELNVRNCAALTTLTCFQNALSGLDLSDCTALTFLDCDNNLLTSLDVSKNAALENLYCSYNKITDLDLSKNPALKSLNCYENRLTALDVNQNPALESLYCNGNMISGLNLTENPSLSYLNCSDNMLTELDLTKNPLLSELYCGGNSLTKLDVEANLTVSSPGAQKANAEIQKTRDGWVTNLSKLVGTENLNKITLAENQPEWLYDAATGTAVYSGETVPEALTYYYNGKNGYNPDDGEEIYFEKGVCVELSFTVVPVQLKISGASLTLEDNLKINYIVKKSVLDGTDCENPYILFSLNGVETQVGDYTENGDNYIFSFADIAPNKMNDTISATLCAEWNGEVITGKTVEYSVAQYCYNTLSKCTDDKYASLRTLIVDLLGYGAKSQLFTGYNTDNLVTDVLTETQAAWGTSEDPVLESVLDREYATVENPSAAWKGAGLYLMDTIEMRFIFAAEDTSGLEICIETANGKTVVPAADFVTDGDYYSVRFNGLNAAQLSENVFVTVYKDGAAVSNTLRYSVESYAASKQNDSDEALAQLVKAMMKYGNSAAAYN